MLRSDRTEALRRVVGALKAFPVVCIAHATSRNWRRIERPLVPMRSATAQHDHIAHLLTQSLARMARRAPRSRSSATHHGGEAHPRGVRVRHRADQLADVGRYPSAGPCGDGSSRSRPGEIHAGASRRPWLVVPGRAPTATRSRSARTTPRAAGQPKPVRPPSSLTRRSSVRSRPGRNCSIRATCGWKPATAIVISSSETWWPFERSFAWRSRVYRPSAFGTLTI